MVEQALAPRQDDGARRLLRLLVDVTHLLPPADDMEPDCWALDRAVAALLLAAHAPGAIAVVMQGERILALSPEQARIVLQGPDAAPAAAMPEPVPPPDTRPTVWRAGTAMARAVVRQGVAVLPAAVREDVRAVLIHLRALVRTLIYGPRVPAPMPAPRPPGRATVLAAPWLVVHPTPGDMVWSAGGSAKLRALAEARHRAGFRLAVLWQQPAEHSGPLATAMLHAVDLVVTLGESERARLAALAAAAGLSPAIESAGAEPGAAAIAALVARRRLVA